MTLIRMTPKLLINLKDEIDNKKLLSMTIGVDQQIYLLFALQHDTWEKPTNRYVIQTDGIKILMQQITHRFGYDIQAISDNRWLIVVPNTNGEDNAFIFDKVWNLEKSFLLGHAVADVQVTNDDCIWVSFFDTGWGVNFNLYEETEEGFSVARWNITGQREYRFPAGDDCYAFNNVTNTETWFYTYPDFPLTQVVNDKVKGRWTSTVTGSKAIAIWGIYVLFCGSYSDHRVLHLYKLDYKDTMQHLGNYQFFDKPVYMKARGHIVTAFNDDKLYQIDLRDIVASL